MENFGAYLKAHREKKGIRLEEIASITKINLHSLELMERNEWMRLPPEPFIKGFITAYAKYVGMDLKDVAERYAKEMSPAEPDEDTLPDFSIPRTSPTEKEEDPAVVIAGNKSGSLLHIATLAGAVIVTVILGIIIYVGRQNSNRSKNLLGSNESATPQKIEAQATSDKETVPSSPSQADDAHKPIPDEKKDMPVAEASHPAPAPMAGTTKQFNGGQKAEDNPNTPVSPSAHEVVVTAKERTWIKVLSDENKPQQSFLSAGESKTFKANDKLRVILGNSTGATVIHNGNTESGTKYDGTIRIYSFPATAHFNSGTEPATKRSTASQIQAKGANTQPPANNSTPSSVASSPSNTPTDITPKTPAKALE